MSIDDRTFERLTASTYVVFCGYSLPPEDKSIRERIKGAFSSPGKSIRGHILISRDQEETKKDPGKSTQQKFLNSLGRPALDFPNG